MSLQDMRIWGIDYGSKLAGTTVIASVEQGVVPSAQGVAAKLQEVSAAPKEVLLFTSQKKKDADRMILDRATDERPDLIFIDAPLSLPGAYFGTDDDFFYRPVDREVGAMSPMFLGGLTARAMRLKKSLQDLLPGIQIMESYPKLRARDLGFSEKGYKKDVKQIQPMLSELINEHPDWHLLSGVESWHQFDALLALSSAVRFVDGQSVVYGPEGGARIFV